MSTCISAQPQDWREGRRLRAWELKQQGWKQQDIAKALGVSPGAVSQWLKAAREGGPEALRRHPAPGPQPRLTPRTEGPDPRASGQRCRSLRVSRGPLDYRSDSSGHQRGFRCQLPPGSRLSAPKGDRLERAKAHPAGHPKRRGGDCGLVCRALAGAKKGAEEEGRTIVWVDESGFYLLPGVVRTYAPRGQTPILRVPLTRDHISAISGITMDGTLLLMVQERAFRSPDVVRFLKHLLRHIPGKLLVVWDGSPIHRGQPVKDFLANGGAERIHLERLPGYAPDLNPDEGIWNYLKRVELRNVRCANLSELRGAMRLAKERLRHKRCVIRGCIKEAGYHV